MSFDQVIGHRRVVDVLTRAHARGKIHHAYLFSGPEGVGKERVAFELFKMLNCREQAGDACDACPACRKLATDATDERAGSEEGGATFADLTILQPRGSFIQVEQVRGATRRLAYRPVEGRWKCVLVRDAERLHDTAANALLKTLEEPSPDTMFVLVTAAPHLLLPTIQSRCQPVRFGPLAVDEIARYLTEHAGVAPEDTLAVAALAEGSIGRALELVEHPVVRDRETWLRSLAKLADMPAHEVFQLSASMAGDRAAHDVHLGLLRGWLRDMLLLAAQGADATVVNRDLREPLEALAKRSDRATLEARLVDIGKAEAALRGNAPAQLTFDWLLMRLARGPALPDHPGLSG